MKTKKQTVAWKPNGIDTQELFLNGKYAGTVRYIPHRRCFRAEAAGIQTVDFHERTNERAKAYLLAEVQNGANRG